MSKKLLLSLIAVLVLIIGALLIIPSFIDWSRYKTRIETQIEQATGYQLQIDGPLSAAFLPYPHATVESVTIDSAAAEGPYAFRGTIDKASVALSLIPLIGGNIVVSDITLVNPVIDVRQRVVEETAEPQPETEAQTEEGAAPNIKINGLSLEGAKITYTALDADPAAVQIPTLRLKADSLRGPFDFEGSLIYQVYSVSIEGESGEYSTTEAFPVKLSIRENTDDLYSVNFSGLADLTNGFGIQGEALVETPSIAAAMTQINQSPMTLADQPLSLQGLVTATREAVKIDNGTIDFGGAKGDIAFKAGGLQEGGTKNIVAQVNFTSPVNLDELLKATGDAETAATQETPETPAGQSPYAYLPSTIEIPSGMRADLAITAPEMHYKGETVKNATIRALLENNEITASLAAGELPGGGAISLDAAMRAESVSRNGASGATVLSDPSLAFDGELAVNSLETVAVDWLGIVPAELMAREGMPQSVSGDITGLVSGSSVTFSSPALKLDNQPPLRTALTYRNGARPTLNIALSGDRFIVPEGLIPENREGGASSGSSDDEGDTASPATMDLTFDIQLGELVFDDKTMQNLNARGSLRGQALTLSPLSIGSFAGTSLAADGTIGNISTLDGLDISVTVDSRNIDPFLQTFNVALPESLPQPIGAVKGTVRAEGTKSLMDVDVDGSVYGFTVSAAGQLSEPMEKGFMPKSFTLSLSHPNTAQAIRVFKEDYQAAPGLQKPLSLRSSITSENDVIQFSSLDLRIGDMTAAGTVNVDNRGEIPAIAADLAFGTLDTQALLGGKESEGNPAASTGGSAGAAASGGSPWTREAIDTGWLRSMNLNLDATAVRLVHGPWEVMRPTLDIALNNGVLTINTLTGTLFDGAMSMTGKASATAEGQPLAISADISAENVNLNPFVQAALGQDRERVRGKGSLDLSLNTKGLSSSALIYALNGEGRIQTSNFTLLGIDLDRISQALAGDNLAGIGGLIDDALNSGSTQFQAVNHAFQIREGTMPVDNFRLQSNTAEIISNGTISFSRWQMDLKNEINITQPEALPVITLNLNGPLNAPRKDLQADIVRSFIMNKYGSEIQEKIQEELGDSIGGQLLQNMLGLPQQEAAPTVETAPVPAAPATGTDAASEAAPAPEAETAPQTGTETGTEPEPSVEEQVIRGLFDQFVK